MEKQKDVVSEVRSFSRFYTNIIGLLNQNILDSPYSLAEARILLEIKKTKDCTANVLADKLDVDRGYMSRILASFETRGLLTKQNSKEDGRILYLHLTQKGKQESDILEEKSDKQIEKLINHLSHKEKEKLIMALNYVEKSLSFGDNPVTIRGYRAEDVAFIIERHEALYQSEYGFTPGFTDYVRKYVVKFDEHHDEEKEYIWIAEQNGKQVGVIAVVKVDETTAQLRWLLIEPEMRGKGLGRKLVETALDFCKEKGYKHVFLLTLNILEAARHLYAGYGFELTETTENYDWANRLILEERWEMDL